MNLRCPFAEWVPWKYPAPNGQPTYYRGINAPIAVVLHIMQGYQRTARQWAEQGMYPKSWHFSNSREGKIMQHLEPQDGGYHAGISTLVATQRPPTWPLWKGPDINVNWYTIGIENEGFFDEPWPDAQRASLKRLCQWISEEWGIPYDRLHFPPHADIDIRDRANDFARPLQRDELYAYLFEEDDMSAEDKARLDRLERLLAANGIVVDGAPVTGEDALAYLDSLGTSAYLSLNNLNAALTDHKANHPSGGATRDDVAAAFQAAEDSILGG